MNASIVRPIAERALVALAPYCERIEVAGGLRRGSADVHDIDVVLVRRTRDLRAFCDVVARWPALKGKPTGKSTTRVVEGINCDISMVSRSTWACLFLMRTGSEEFSKSVVSYARHIDREFHEGFLRVLSTRVDIPVLEEADVFEELGLPWIEPSQRTGRLEDILGRAFFRR